MIARRLRYLGLVPLAGLLLGANPPAPSGSASAPAVSVANSAASAPSAPPLMPPAPGGPQALPPGHPSIDGPPVQAGPLPQGHPQVPQDDDPGLPNIPRDKVMDDPALGAGIVEATIVDDKEKPLAGVTVTLDILKSSVAQGDSRSKATAVTDALGHVRFPSLQRGSGWVYKVLVTSVGSDPSVVANFSSQQFQLPFDHGLRVLMHKYPVTGSLDGLLAGVEVADTIIEVRDDVIEVQQIFDVVNASTTAWGLGAGLTVSLPVGFKGLRTGEAMGDYVVTPIEGVGARWTGSFAPGMTRVGYDFKIPYEGDANVDLSMILPPRVLAARVRVAARKGMTLHVEGFGDAHTEVAQNGEKYLTVIKQATPQNNQPISSLKVRIEGLPSQGPEKWFAFGGGLALVVAGFFFALRPPAREQDKKALATALKRQQRAVLDEIVLLEKAHRAGDIGPQAYERERAKLVDQLADVL